ncbi:MAG: DUF1501 domain-containing protein, partial [Planctomycetales bacterium]
MTSFKFDANSPRAVSDSEPSTRRHFLESNAMGLSSLALAWLLAERSSQGDSPKPLLERPRFDLTAKPPHAEPRAKAMISLWMQGGPSHIDLFDPKPEMAKHDGKPFSGKIKYDNAAQASSKVFHSPWKFRPRGQCGMEVSDLLPHFAGIADDVALVRSTQTGVNNHGQSIRALNTGEVVAGRPSLGSWLTYAMGSENPRLPAYLALIDPGQLPVLGVENWSNGWLPAIYQGTVVRPQEPRILNLDAPPRLQGAAKQEYLAFLQRLNRRHADHRPGELDLQARIASYELAAHMQTAAKEALDLSRETEATKRL